MKSVLVRIALPALLLVCQFALAQASRTVFLVRNAEASSAAPNAPLSLAGERRAECLARTLGDAGIKQIYVSEAKRTQQTADPLAKRLKLTPSTVASKDVSSLVRNILYGTGGNVLVVSSSDVLPVLTQRMQAGKIKPIAENEFDQIFMITVTEGVGSPVTTLRYCEAPISNASAGPEGKRPVIQAAKLP